MEFFGVEVGPGPKGQLCEVLPGHYLHISQLALGGNPKDDERVVVQVEHKSKKFVIGTLTKGRCDQMQVDLVIEQSIRLFHNGSSSIYALGYLSEPREDYLTDDSEEEEEDNEEDAGEEELADPKRPAPVGNGKPAKTALAQAEKEKALAKPKDQGKKKEGEGKAGGKMFGKEFDMEVDEEEEEDSDFDVDDEDDDEEDEDLELDDEEDDDDEDDDEEDDDDDEDEEDEDDAKAKKLGDKRPAKHVENAVKKQQKSEGGAIARGTPKTPVGTKSTPGKAKGTPATSTTPASDKTPKKPAATPATPKSIGNFVCSDCPGRKFNTEAALGSHRKDKHKA